jgi:hypothetical protein
MRKTSWAFVVVLAIAGAPAPAYADFQLGGIGLYNGDITTIGSSAISSSDFTFGLESRFTFLSVLQFGVTGLYYLPSAEQPSYIQALTDLGLSVKILFLRLGAGVGPDFFIPMSGLSVEATSLANLKLSADIEIGPVSLGVTAFYPVQSLGDFQNIPHMSPWLGAALLIRLF